MRGFSRKEVVKAISEIKARKAAGPSEVSDSSEWGDWDWCDGGAVSGGVGSKRNVG